MNKKTVAQNYPALISRVDTRDKSYFPLDFLLEQEQENPAGVKVWTKEPLAVGESCVFGLGFKELNHVYVCRVLSCSQQAQNYFESDLVEAHYELLQKEVLIMSNSISLKEVLQRVCSNFDLNVSVVGELSNQQETVYFPFSVRNTLDQLKQVFSCPSSSYFFNTTKSKFVWLVDGSFDQDAFDVELGFLRQEKQDSIDFFPIPAFKPFVNIIWREEKRVIYSAKLDSRSQVSSVRFM